MQGLPDPTYLGCWCCEQGKAQGHVAAGAQCGHGAAEERQDFEEAEGGGRREGKEGQGGRRGDARRGDAELRGQSAAHVASVDNKRQQAQRHHEL